MSRADTTTDTLPATIDRYRILERLHSDRPDELYRGFDPNIERPLVLRVFRLPPMDAAEMDAVRQSFFEEMQRTGMLTHSGITTLYDAGVLPDGLFMASEYVEGTSLAAFAEQGLGPIAERVSILVQIADAIDYAHAQDVLHLDLQPTDVLLGADSTVKIRAFGVAKVHGAIGNEVGALADLVALVQISQLLLGDATPSGHFQTAGEFKYAMLLALGLDELQVKSAWEATREAGSFLAANHGAGTPQTAVNGDLTSLLDSNAPTQLTPSGVESLITLLKPVDSPEDPGPAKPA